MKTPRCWYHAIDSRTGQSVLLLEDLAPAVQAGPVEGASLEQAETALETAALLHAWGWAAEERAEIRELARLLERNWIDDRSHYKDWIFGDGCSGAAAA